MSKQFDEYLLKEMQEDDDHDLVFSPENVEEEEDEPSSNQQL